MKKSSTPVKVDVCIFDCATEGSPKQTNKRRQCLVEFEAQLKPLPGESEKTKKRRKSENENLECVKGDFFVPDFDTDSPKHAMPKNRPKSSSKERRLRKSSGSPSPRKRNKYRLSTGDKDEQGEVTKVEEITSQIVESFSLENDTSRMLGIGLKTTRISKTPNDTDDGSAGSSCKERKSEFNQIPSDDITKPSYRPQEIPLPSSRKSLYKVKGPTDIPNINANNIFQKKISVLKVPSGVVLHLDHPQTLSLRGKALLSVLYGEASLLGHTATSTCSPVEVYSPTCNSFMSLSTEPGQEKDIDKLRTRLKNLMLPSGELKTLLTEITPGSVFVLLQKLSNVCCDYVATVLPFRQLFGKGLPVPYREEYRCCNDALQTIGVQIVPSKEGSGPPVLAISEDFNHVKRVWCEALQEQGESKKCKLLSCGGKNAGKSTLNRFLINATLQRVSSVCYLDCDVGQTEFNPPGCVALHVISKPVLGPPFTHQRDPAFMCYYGPVNPGESPSMYSECIKRVYAEYEKHHARIPLIINTLGWNKGLGVNLLIDACHLTRPDLIVQLESRNQTNNFPAITPEFVSSPGWLFNREVNQDGRVQPFTHKLTIIDSPVHPSIESQLRFHPKDHRNLSILGYFSRCLKYGLYSDLQAVQPYKVSWSNMAVCVSHMAVPPSEVLNALNASLVGLCVADHRSAHRPAEHPDSPLQFSETPICQCLGLGIVRGIDPVEKMFYIISPLDPSTLLHVNTLVRGVSNIPDELMLKQRSRGEVPYVNTHQTVTGASSVRPRRYMPRKKYEAQKTSWL